MVLGSLRSRRPGLEVAHQVAGLRLLLFQSASHPGFAERLHLDVLRLAALTLARRCTRWTILRISSTDVWACAPQSLFHAMCAGSLPVTSGQMRLAFMPRPLRCCIQKAGGLAAIWQVAVLHSVPRPTSRSAPAHYRAFDKLHPVTLFTHLP